MVFTERLAPFSMLVLRIGLGIVFLWFGINELLDPFSWTLYVPDWGYQLGFVSAKQMVIANGVFEVIIGTSIIIGFYLRWASLLLFLHFFPIIASVGYNEIGVRDFGLHMAALSLTLTKEDAFSFDCYLRTGSWFR